MASRFGQVCIIKSVTHGFVLDLFSGMLFSHQEYAGIFSGSYSPDETLYKSVCFTSKEHGVANVWGGNNRKDTMSGYLRSSGFLWKGKFHRPRINWITCWLLPWFMFPHSLPALCFFSNYVIFWIWRIYMLKALSYLKWFCHNQSAKTHQHSKCFQGWALQGLKSDVHYVT